MRSPARLHLAAPLLWLLRVAAVALVLAGAGLASVAAAPASAATYVVDRQTDEADGDLSDEICAIDQEHPASGCTLRAAIQNVNKELDDGDVIGFNLPSGREWISPERGLPAILDTVHIDGTSQPGFSGEPIVRIDGSKVPRHAPLPPLPNGSPQIVRPYGLELRGVYTKVDAIKVDHFQDALIGFAGAHGSTLTNSFLGTADGAAPNEQRALVGVWVKGSSDMTVGGSTVADRNVIGGNWSNITVSGEDANDNMVRGNYLGVGPDGKGLLGPSKFGVLATSDEIGLAARTSIVANIIAQTEVGVRIVRVPNAIVVGNFIGVDRFGAAESPGGVSYGASLGGIDVQSAPDTIVGDHSPGFGNIIAGAKQFGIRVIFGAKRTVVEGNHVGTNVAGTDVAGSDGKPTGNRWGIIVQGGTNAEESPADTMIGGPDPQDANVVSGNEGGILVWSIAADTAILSNLIGAGRDGRGALPNTGVGITTREDDDGAPIRTQIGRPGDGNVISDSGSWAIAIEQAKDPKIQGNLVGIDGKGDAGEVAGGIVTVEDDTVIGGRGEGEGNVVAASTRDGIIVGGPADGVKVLGNQVGTDRLGHAPAPGTTNAFANNGYGIAVREDGSGGRPTGTRIGGPLPGEGNLVAGNTDGQIAVLNGSLTRVSGNLVGLQPDGTTPASAPGDGIRVEADQTFIGSDLGEETSNHIVSTQGAAVRVRGASEVGIQGNQIGFGVGGEDLGVKGAGVVVDEDSSTVIVGFLPKADVPVDCAEACNRIGQTADGAVLVEGDNTREVTIRGNRLRDSNDVAIDLGADGPDRMDRHDDDDGPNDKLNNPGLVRGAIDPRTGKSVVTGTIVGAGDPHGMVVDVYGHPGRAGASGPQDIRYLGRAQVDGNGHFLLEAPDAASKLFTATATDDEGNTSEFAEGCTDVRVPGKPDSDGDGLCDDWEIKQGVDLDGDGSIDQALAGADPDRRDLYLELDYMRDPRFDERTLLSAVHSVRGVFNRAPGGGITLHAGDRSSGSFQTGEEVAHAEHLAVGEDRHRQDREQPDDLGDLRYGTGEQECDGWFGSDEQRADEGCWKILAARGATFRYGVIADEIASGDIAAAESGEAFAVGLGGQNPGDIAQLGGGTGVCMTDEICHQSVLEGVLLHELGHTLGLEHGGEHAESALKPNYLSVMNPGLALPAFSPNRPLDLSGETLPPLDERDLSEPAGLASNPATGWSETVMYRYDPRHDECVAKGIPLNKPVDFDGDKRATNPHAQASLDEPDQSPNAAGAEACEDPAAKLGKLEGFDDWAHLTMNPVAVRGPFPEHGKALGADLDVSAMLTRADTDDDGIVNHDDVCNLAADPGQADEDGDDIGDACLPFIDERDVSVALKVDRAPAEGAGQVAVTATLANSYPLPATGLRVGLTLPEGWEPAATTTGGTWNAGNATWTVPSLGKRSALTLRLVGPADQADGEIVAELEAAGEPDPDSIPGGGEPEEDDRSVAFTTSPTRVSAADVAHVEGTRVSRAASIAVTLTKAPTQTVRVRATTKDGSATAPQDYAASTKLLVFAPGDTTRTLDVPVVADGRIEPDETFTVQLTDVTGAELGRAEATVTIRNDDADRVPGALTPLTCVGAKKTGSPCAIQESSLDGVTGVQVVGDRDVYVTDTARITLLQRDPATERLSFKHCYDLGRADRRREQCERLKVPVSSDVASAATIKQLAVSADGSLLAAGVTSEYTAQGHGVYTMRRDPATGLLSLAGCIGTPFPTRGCLGQPMWLGDELLVSPDARFVYLASGDAVDRIALTDGVPVRRDSDLLGDQGPLQAPHGAALSPDGRTYVSSTNNALVTYARDGDTGGLTRTGSVGAPRYATLSISPDGTRLYAAAPDVVRSFRLPDLAPVGCAAKAPSGTDPCLQVDALDGPLGVTASADGDDVYVGLVGGGTVQLRQAARGAFSGGRCVDPEAGIATCGTPKTGGPSRSGGPVQLTADGRAAFAFDGSYLHQLLRFAEPTPGTNRAPLCSDSRSFGQIDAAQRLRLDCVDPDGDPLTVSIVGQPQHGTLGSLDAAGGGVTYTPGAGRRGADAFTFRASDGIATSRDARVDLDVNNAAPVCSGGGGVTRTSRPTQVAVYCTDPEGEPVTIELVEGPAHGTLSAFDGNRATYTPQAGWRGVDRFRVRARDRFDVSDEFVSQISVGDQPPQCKIYRDNAMLVNKSITLPHGCVDPEGDKLTFKVDAAGLGTVRVEGGNFVFKAGSKPGRGVVTVIATDVDGQSGEMQFGVGVYNPVASCRDDCRPDDAGTVTIEYLCDGQKVGASKYASCQGSAVMVVCSSKSNCRYVKPTGGGARASTSAAAAKGMRLKAKILPGVKGTRLAQTQISIKPGAAGKLELKLGKASMKLLRRKGKLRVALVIETRALSGKTKRTTKVLTIKPPKKPRK